MAATTNVALADPAVLSLTVCRPGGFCRWPIDPWPASDPAEIAAFRLEAELEAVWRALREFHRSGQGVPENLPEDVEPWEPDPGLPYEQWPGLRFSRGPRRVGSCPRSTRSTNKTTSASSRWAPRQLARARIA